MTSQTKNRSASRSRRLICGALLELLGEKELANITVTELVERADLNRSTFYAHYSNLVDVLDEIEDMWLAALTERLEARGAQSVSPELVGSHLLQLVEQLGLAEDPAGFTPSTADMLRRVADRYLLLCLEAAPAAVRSAPFFELHLRMAVDCTLDLVCRWMQGDRCTNCTFRELSQELVLCFGKL